MKALLSITGGSLLILIFLALFVPTSYQEIKTVFLLLALAGVVLLASSSKLFWSGKTLLACFLLATFGLANSLHGELNEAPGAIRVLSVVTVWPILYGIMSAMLSRPDAIRMVAATLTIALVAILVYSFLFLGNMAGIVPDAVYFELKDQGQTVGFYDGRVRIGLYSVTSLLFLMPFWTHYLLILNRENTATFFHWALLFIGLVLCVLTGRIAVQIVVLMSFFILIVTEAIVGGGIRVGLRLFRGLSNWRSAVIVIIGAFALLSAFLSMDVRLDALVENIVSGFNFDDASNPDASVRGDQYISLMHAWLDGNVLFGAGNGSHTGYLRSDDMPWAYELTYVYMLFSTGIVGILFQCGWFGWGLLRIRGALMRRPDMEVYVAPMITGVFGLAIGAASNPYLGKFDYLWITLLPHMLAGAVSYQGRRMVRKHVNPS